MSAAYLVVFISDTCKKRSQWNSAAAEHITAIVQGPNKKIPAEAGTGGVRMDARG